MKKGSWTLRDPEGYQPLIDQDYELDKIRKTTQKVTVKMKNTIHGKSYTTAILTYGNKLKKLKEQAEELKKNPTKRVETRDSCVIMSLLF